MKDIFHNIKLLMVACLIACRVCRKGLNGSTVIKPCGRANNHKITHCDFRNEQKLSRV